MKVHIPTPLRQYAEKRAIIEVRGHTVSEALEELVSTFHELRRHLFTDEGKLRSFVNIYVNDEDIRYLEKKEQTEVKDADEIYIVPSIAGGTSRATAAVHEGGFLCTD